MQISLAGAELYVRTFWFVLIGVPIFGLIALIIGTTPIIRYIGMVSLLWPVTIPARAGLITSRVGRQLMRPTVVEILEEAVVFEDSQDPAVRMGMRYESIRSVRIMRGLYALMTRRFAFTVFPIDSFLTESDRDRFEALLEENGLTVRA
jgi:hypothetical protein